MDTDLETLATALYVRVDDLLKDRPELVPPRPRIGLRPKLSDAELITMAVLQVLLGFDDEARWVRHAKAHLGHLFPYVPGQAGVQQAAPQGGIDMPSGDATPRQGRRCLG